MKYLAAIDVGTTGAKAGIFSFDGTIISSGYREYTCTYPKPNWVEQDADEIIQAAFAALKEAVCLCGADPCHIISLAASTQRTCSIFIDESNRAMKLISWQDGRTSAELEEIKSIIPYEEYYGITGLPLNTTWIVTKMLWARKNLPELWSKTKRVVQLQDYLLKQLGADDFYVDVPDAVLYGLWDTDNFCWSDSVIDRLGIDKAMLPIPTKCGTRIAKLSQEAALLTGLCAGTPICVGAGDQNAAAIGAGVISEGIASVSIGTGGMAIISLDKPYRDESMMDCIGASAVFGKWQIEGYQIGAAGVFRWFRDNIADLENVTAKAQNASVYDKLNEMIATTPPGANGLVFLPFFASSGAPRWDSNARGSLLGLTFAHTKSHMARAFMEGITMEQKDILNSMRATGNDIGEIRIMGGATKSKIWCQMQADMFNAPVKTLKVQDAALVGAAIFAGTGVGVFEDIADGVEQMVKPDTCYTPNAETAKTYDKLYEIYDRAYKGLKAMQVYDLIAQFQE